MVRSLVFAFPVVPRNYTRFDAANNCGLAPRTASDFALRAFCEVRRKSSLIRLNVEPLERCPPVDLIRVRHGGDTAQAHMLVDGEDFRLRPDPCNNALSQTVHTASSRRPSRARARARRFRFTNVTLDHSGVSPLVALKSGKQQINPIRRQDGKLPIRIVPGPDIPIHRITFANCRQDGQQMLPRDTGRRYRGLPRSNRTSASGSFKPSHRDTHSNLSISSAAPGRPLGL